MSQATVDCMLRAAARCRSWTARSTASDAFGSRHAVVVARDGRGGRLAAYAASHGESYDVADDEPHAGADAEPVHAHVHGRVWLRQLLCG